MELDFFEPMKPHSRSHYAYEQIRKAIISGNLKPGAVLNIKRLGEQLKISDSPVREALHLLAGEGFVKYEPQSGAVVKSMSKDELLNIMVVRHYLEIMALKLSLPNLTEADFADGKAIIDKMEAAANASDAISFCQNSREFHTFLCFRCPNDYLLQSLLLSWDRSECTRSLAMFRFKTERIQTSFEEHRQIYAAAAPVRKSASLV